MYCSFIPVSALSIKPDVPIQTNISGITEIFKFDGKNTHANMTKDPSISVKKRRKSLGTKELKIQTKKEPFAMPALQSLAPASRRISDNSTSGKGNRLQMEFSGWSCDFRKLPRVKLRGLHPSFTSVDCLTPANPSLQSGLQRLNWLDFLCISCYYRRDLPEVENPSSWRLL